MPHPEVAPADVPDWRPLLDRELSRLSERYRAAVVLCDLEGQSRKEAALLLGVPERTLASRLTRAHALLARRLRGRGVLLSGGALATLAADATAQVPAALLRSTARVAALVATGNLAGAQAAPVVLMKGVMRAMLIRKLKVVAVAVAATAALGVVGLASRTGQEVRAQDAGTPAARAGGKPASELEALRRENADLHATVRVLLKEIQRLQRGSDAGPRKAATGARFEDSVSFTNDFVPPKKNGSADEVAHQSVNKPYRNELVDPGAKTTDSSTRAPVANPNDLGHPPKTPSWSKDMPAGGRGQTPDQDQIGAAREVEEALQAWLRAGDPESRRRAAEALDRATRRLRERYAPTTRQQ
jgi:hypothetical protein